MDNVPISKNLLLRIAKEAGLRARSTRLDWHGLVRLGEAYPVVLRLANGNWIIVSAVAMVRMAKKQSLFSTRLPKDSMSR